ncbi:MAG: type IV pilus twitching motility protein PilT [Sumerlaeia bacterium]
MAVIDQLFDIMLAHGASDLHLAEDKPPKLRLHGRVEVIQNWPALERERLRGMLEEICDEPRWESFERTGDMDFAYSYPGKARFRCNFNKQYTGYGAVFRVIPSRILTLAELRAPEVLKSFGDYAAGLVLITGPTGSGKSTTLAGIIDHINSTYAKHILTIEEPIEFVHPVKKSTIAQREVHIDTPSFSEALRTASRQDVDVILVGEMRDLETINLAVTAAETGALVFGTLHTNNAIKTIDRIIDVFPSDQQEQIRSTIAESLRAICAQLLLRTADGKGRRAAQEILLQTRAVANYIREKKVSQINQVIMSNKNMGMQLMDDCIEGFLNEGVVDPQEAYMKAIDKERFRGRLTDPNLKALG